MAPSPPCQEIRLYGERALAFQTQSYRIRVLAVSGISDFLSPPPPPFFFPCLSEQLWALPASLQCEDPSDTTYARSSSGAGEAAGNFCCSRQRFISEQAELDRVDLG